MVGKHIIGNDRGGMSGGAVLGEVSPIWERVVVAAVNWTPYASSRLVVSVVLSREVSDPIGRHDGVGSSKVGGRGEGGAGAGDGGGDSRQDGEGGDAGQPAGHVCG